MNQEVLEYFERRLRPVCRCVLYGRREDGSLGGLTVKPDWRDDTRHTIVLRDEFLVIQTGGMRLASMRHLKPLKGFAYYDIADPDALELALKDILGRLGKRFVPRSAV